MPGDLRHAPPPEKPGAGPPQAWDRPASGWMGPPQDGPASGWMGPPRD
eukprot:CAMPEP_0180159944 /NCGR_PEP_ID=MMETSP0986-20121125/27820_1 /TAXON_ID=697907 /ORGANISM="non described non described, Strain CCMP2293" /LENGTH=47 /DNA_ID= /DNA_START= /DNA_END= /DNA_ORIENTATION=